MAASRPEYVLGTSSNFHKRRKISPHESKASAKEIQNDSLWQYILDPPKQAKTPGSKNNPKLPVDGDTPLHTLLRQFAGLQSFRENLKKYSTEQLFNMGKTVNNLGGLPFDLVQSLSKNNCITEDQAQELEGVLFTFMTTHKFKKFSTAINVEEVLREHKSASGTRLCDYLRLGCDAINKTRRVVTYSLTHPDTDLLPKKTVEKIETRMEDLREKLAGLAFDACLGAYPKSRYLQDYSRYVKESGVAGCGELSILIYYFVKQKTPSIPIELFKFYEETNGDHQLTILGRDPATDPNDYTSWNEDAVVVDGLFGEVFPVKDIPQRLTLYRHLQIAGQDFNCGIKFNPHFHHPKKDQLPYRPEDGEGLPSLQDQERISSSLRFR